MARNKYDEDEELGTPFSWAYTKRLLSYVVPYKKEMFATLIVMLISSISTLLGPYLVKIVTILCFINTIVMSFII